MAHAAVEKSIRGCSAWQSASRDDARAVSGVPVSKSASTSVTSASSYAANERRRGSATAVRHRLLRACVCNSDAWGRL